MCSLFSVVFGVVVGFLGVVMESFWFRFFKSIGRFCRNIYFCSDVSKLENEINSLVGAEI
jgi:hypothetical protein